METKSIIGRHMIVAGVKYLIEADDLIVMHVQNTATGKHGTVIHIGDSLFLDADGTLPVDYDNEEKTPATVNRGGGANDLSLF